MGGGLAEDAGDVAEKIIDQVAPVAVHVHDHAAAVFTAVVPRGALDGLALVLAGENPVAELPADREDPAEEALFLEELVFTDAGQPELILHGSVFHPGLLCDLSDPEGFRVKNCGRFFTVNVLPRGDGTL